MLNIIGPSRPNYTSVNSHIGLLTTTFYLAGALLPDYYFKLKTLNAHCNIYSHRQICLKMVFLATLLSKYFHGLSEVTGRAKNMVQKQALLPL